MKSTKIVCTIGPASDTVEMIRKLRDEGMNVARLNFSHGSYDYFTKVIRNIRKVSKELAIMLDTKGPEIRSGEVEGGRLELRGGDHILLTEEQIGGNKDVLTINYHKLKKLHPGCKILIDDGLIGLQVTAVTKRGVRAVVLNGGILGSKKTVSIQGHNVELPFMREKDIEDITFGVKMGVDFVAASFVRRKEDVVELKALLQKLGSRALAISKIEHGEAVRNLDEIILASDGIMVARGDLGVEIPMQKVPGVQAIIINKCNNLGKPVIVATQMLESMKENPRPTRAEVADIAQAILQGADAVMLSGETASGKYPSGAVQVMAKIAHEYDRFVSNKVDDTSGMSDECNGIALFVTQAAFNASARLKTAAIITPTNSGFTARKVSRFRPRCPICAFVNDLTIYRQLQISWGVLPILLKKKHKFPGDLIIDCVRLVHKAGIVSPEDTVVITAGFRLSKGHTNILEIYKVKDVLSQVRKIA